MVTPTPLPDPTDNRASFKTGQRKEKSVTYSVTEMLRAVLKLEYSALIPVLKLEHSMYN